MDIKKFGKYFYYSTLAVAILGFIVGKNILNGIENISEEVYIRYWNFIQYLVFGVVISIGVIVREFILVPHIKKFMFLKLTLFSLQLLLCIPLFFIIPTVSTSYVILYIAYGIVIISLLPTYSFRKFD